MFRNYFNTVVRNLRRNKIYSFINILGLSFGLAAAMLIILYVKDEVSFDRFHKNVGQIHRIGVERTKPDGSPDFKGGYTGYFQGPRFTAGIPEIKAFSRFQSARKDIKRNNEIQSLEMFAVDTNFFSMFSFPLIHGDPGTVLLEPHSVVISEDFAKQQFGTTNAVGKVIMMKDEGVEFLPYAVTGVAKRSPQNSSIRFEAVIPFTISKEDETRNENWLNYFLSTFVVLQKGANIQSVQKKMDQVYEREARESIKIAAERYGDNSSTHWILQRFTDMHLSKDYRADNGLTGASKPMYSYILSGIAIFILLIACINFVNLTVARSVRRAKEIGVRKVIGGQRSQLIFQFLGESFFLCFVAFIFAIVLVQLVLPVFNEVSNKSLALSYLFDVRLIVGYLFLFVLTSLLAGFYPAWILSAYNPVQTLYNRFVIGGKNYLQRGLVVLQFALASFLIIATFTIYSQFNFLTNVKLGYDDKNIVLVNIPTSPHDKVEPVKEELTRIPSIENVAFRNGGRWGTVAKVNGETQIPFAYETVNETFLPMLKIPVIKGRNFSNDFPSDSTHSVLVNETFARKAGWRNPIGQVVDFWYNNEKYNVIGVVKDYHFESLALEIAPQVFTMKPGNAFGRIVVKIKPGTETASLGHIEKTFKKLFPSYPYVYTFMDAENRKNYEQEAKWKQIMMFGAILTIFISCIGLFGLAVLSAEKRTKEIGIRKVLGASVGRVVTILSKDFLKLVMIALLISIPSAWLAANRWLDHYPYRISLSWSMFALAAVMVVFIALITVSFQAVKAAIANPVKSLKTE